MNLDQGDRADKDPSGTLATLSAEYAAEFREREKAWRDRRAKRRDVMPPRLWCAKAALDMSPVTLAGRAVIEARQALEDAKTALGRVALDAYYQGCPATTIAASAGMSTVAISRYSWRAFDELHGEAPGGS